MGCVDRRVGKEGFQKLLEYLVNDDYDNRRERYT